MSELSGFARLSGETQRERTPRRREITTPALLERHCAHHILSTLQQVEESTISHRQPAAVTLTVFQLHEMLKTKNTRRTPDMIGRRKENVASLLLKMSSSHLV